MKKSEWPVVLWLEQFNLIQGVGAKTVQVVRQATTTQNQIKLLQPYDDWVY
ncbi:tmRNA [Candidatus Regiella insecticola 5.15]|uniref:TmRNA n=1 Tax=Candidatus Regiella insecticola 5.15 TaxID=1005043 RepID=G2GXS7_9ENTR|nr:tmRNA [Candidatus Regiella insecticola 5.15]